MDGFILYGWHLSYFAGKVRCYLRHKRIAFADQPVNLFTLAVSIRRRTGAMVMPVLVTPEGEWLQDSSVIIDRLEQRFPLSPVVPTGPVQRFAAYLLEAWGDEWWIPVAMHTRWSHPENYALWEHDAGPHLLPHFPAFLQRRAAARVAGAMRAKLRDVGVVPAQFATIERWTDTMLDHLDRHFSTLPYLLGERASLADFSLAGSMYGHLGRDPWPRRELVASRPGLRAWIDRMAEPPAAAPADFLPGDRIAVTLEPVLRAVCAEFLPMLEATLAQVRAALPHIAPGRALARGLGTIEFPMGEARLRRTALPYSLWMAQRALDVFRSLASPEQQAVRDWLATLGGERLLALDIPRLRRVALRVAPE